MSRVLVVLSAPPAQARSMLAAARARFPDSQLTVLLRTPQMPSLADLLAGAEVIDDKPAGGRLTFLRRLRHTRFDHGLVAWTGAWSFWPSKLAFGVARVRAREVVTERGTVAWSWPNIGRHLLWRVKSPVHATAGMPPGIPWPLALVLAALRATLGRIVGPILTLARTAALRPRAGHD